MMNLKISALATEDINKKAEVFLSTYHPSLINSTPIEEIIELQLGMDIIPLPELKDNFSRMGLQIDAFISSNLEDISIDEYIYNKIQNRCRFSLAHEIGHKVLHEYVYRECSFNTIDGWVDILNSINPGDLAKLEWQADEFAGLILVPRAILGSAFKTAITQMESLLDISYKKNPDLVLDNAISFILAPGFKVANSTVKIRLERDRLLKR